MTISRRSFLAAAPLGSLWASTTVMPQSTNGSSAPPPASFPTHDPARAREMVAVSHGNVGRVRELLAASPALAKASWDWGYGDWETALGAASHVGNPEIALLLLGSGAGPTIFSAAMLGQLATVQAFIAATPGVQRMKGPHGISLLSHAKAGGATEVTKYLESLGDANPTYVNDTLSDTDRAAILGSYAFGAGPTDRLSVSVNTRGGLVIQREGAVERNLFHLGGRVFHPTGAEAVRIRFAPGERAPTVTIEDGAVVVIARRT